MSTQQIRLDTARLEELTAEVDAMPDEVDGLSMADSKRDAAYKLTIAINAVKVLRKLSARPRNGDQTCPLI